MSINFGLAREIYGASPWYVDQETLPSLLSILDNRLELDVPQDLRGKAVKYNTPECVISSESKLIRRPWQLDNKDSFEGIGLVNINGPITRTGGASSYGMAQLSVMMRQMAEDDRVKSFIVLADSGGGAASAVEIMAETISEINNIKPVYGIIEKGGISASACYGILSACREIYAESPMSIVGSAGTMIQFEGRAANSESPDGKKFKRIYASKSTQKNIEIEEALNNDNYELVINNLLDPMNENFLNLIQTNRPVLKGTDFDNGKTLFAKDAVGTFIDGIKTFDEVVAIAENSEKTFTPPPGPNSINNKVMTVDELKQKHPETYNSIFKQGISAEKSRVKAWMAYAGADLNAVKAGVIGEETVDSSREDLLIKMTSLNHVKNLENDSAKEFKTGEFKSEDTKSDDDKELEALDKQIDEQLKTV